MRRTTPAYLRAESVGRALRVGLRLVVAFVIVGEAAAYARFLVFSRELDRAMEVAAAGATTEVTWSFPFQRDRITVHVPVHAGERTLGESVDTSAVFGRRAWLRDAYVRRLVSAHVASPLIGRLAAEFRRVRDVRVLDDDEYLELMVAGVQAIPYGAADASVAFPAEVLTGGEGVCTDKSLLLASLLVHEGYDTCVWVFPSQWHVGVGVASNGAQLGGSGYAFIETTGPAFIGQTGHTLAARGPVLHPPQQIAVGGRRAYDAGDETEYILRELRLAQTTAAALGTHTQGMRIAVQRPVWYTERTTETWVARGRARYILANTHDRHAVYRVLSHTSADAAPAGAAPGRQQVTPDRRPGA